jgi:hypothetical protein
MNTATMNACLAELSPAEIQDGPRMIDAWLRAGWMDEDEATEWRLRLDAWRGFHGLEMDQGPPF